MGDVGLGALKTFLLTPLCCALLMLDSYEQKWLTQEFMKQETWLPFLALAFTFFLLLEKSLKTRSVCRLGLSQASDTQDLCEWIT